MRVDKRAVLLRLARERGRPTAAIVFDLPDSIYLERNRTRPDRTIPEHAVVAQIADMRRTLATIDGEGFDQIVRVAP